MKKEMLIVLLGSTLMSNAMPPANPVLFPTIINEPTYTRPYAMYVRRTDDPESLPPQLIADPVAWIAVSPYPVPCIRWTKSEATALMNQLWTAGIRPKLTPVQAIQLLWQTMFK